MKAFFNIFGVVAAGVVGYMAEPNLRVQLTGVPLRAVEVANNGKIALQMNDGAPLVDLATVPAEQLPKKIKVNTPVKVTDVNAGITMTIEAGSSVTLVRVEDANAVVSPGEGSLLGKVPVMDTDLLQQLAKIKAATPVAPVTPEPPVAPEPVAPEPVTPPVGESEEPEKTPEAPPTPEPAPEPKPAVIEIPGSAPMNPEPAGDKMPEGAQEVILAMQESVKAGAIKEFTFDQVTDWKPGADETIDGESYQTGMASYSAETIFGMKKIQAKALVKAGKVHRWIWPKSGMEIK